MSLFEILTEILLVLILVFVIGIWSSLDSIRRDLRITNQVMERHFGTVMKELVRKR